MNFVFFLLAVIFGGLFILRQIQYRHIKDYTQKLEDELANLRSQQINGASDLQKSNDEFVQKPTDALTGLPDRHSFDDRLQQAVLQGRRYQTPFGVMTVDVNKFSDVNNISYEMGDMVLKQLALRLQSCIRQVDTISRYMGNTFVILLPQITKPETAAYVAQRIQDNLMQPFHIENQDIFLSVSIGIAIAPMDGIDSKTLLHNSSKALKIAKTQGKTAYQFFRQEIHALSERQLTLHTLVGSPDFVNKLQIQYSVGVDSKTNAVKRVEAIPYFHHDTLGDILYPEFINMAENAGKSEEICIWLLKKVLTQLKAWRTGEFRPTQAAINVTLKQIQNPDFVTAISDVITSHAVDEVKILFELSDANLSSPNATQLNQAILSLYSLGVQFSVGIYTLGHFALQKVTNIPISFLKVDAKLIYQSPSEKNQDELLKMMLSLANSSNIGVIADGVNTEKDKRLLANFGCDILQGPLFVSLLPDKHAMVS